MRIIIIILAYFLTGCSIGSSGGNDDDSGEIITALYIGDSLCNWRKNRSDALFWESLDMDVDCKYGRKLVDVDMIQSYETVFLALGTNDSLSNINPYEFETHLIQLIHNTDANIICVLPMDTPLSSAHTYQEIMINHCDDAIYPPDYGIYADFKDGIHITSAMDYLWRDMINQYLRPNKKMSQ